MTYMISIVDLIFINMGILRIDSGFFLEKEFNELIYINPWMILYLIVNQVDSCDN